MVENESPEGSRPKAIMETSHGEIVIELFNDKVPNTCENFMKYARDGFFSDLIFHRVIKGFMIQGGGFDESMTKKSSMYPPIKLEIHPDVIHVDGAISMARTNDPNSATSQFYLCDGPQKGLDRNYAAFGKVISGMDVIRSICGVRTHSSRGHQDVPVESVFIRSVRIE